MPKRFVPVTDYSITHYAAGAGPVRATIDLYDRTGKVTLVGTLEFLDAPAAPSDGNAAFAYGSLRPIVDTLRNERPLLACVDVDSGRVLYLGTQQLEPAGEDHEK